MSLQGKDTESDKSIHIIDAKTDSIGLESKYKTHGLTSDNVDFLNATGYDLDEEIAGFENLSEEYKSEHKSLWDRFLYLEYEINFKNKNNLVWMLGLFAACGGFLSGIDQSLISGANIFLPDDLELTSGESSLVTALMPLGAAGGSLLMSPINEYVGRRMLIIIACIFYTIGGILEAAAPDVGEMYAGRFILGLGVGLEGSTVPTYVSECCPLERRGSIVSLYQWNIAFGEVCGFVVLLIFVDVPGNWRYMLGSSLVFSTFLLIGMYFLPESPRFLVHKNRTGHLYYIWQRLRDMDEVKNRIEFLEIHHNKLNQDQEENSFKIWLNFIKNPRDRRSFIYANIMIILGQFTGANGMLYYLSTLMQSIGFNERNSVFMSLVGTGALLIGTTPLVLYMDKFGRRFWANLMIPGFFIGLILVGVGYLIPLESNRSALTGTYMTGMIIYWLFFGNYACLSWVVPSESYSMKMRSRGMTSSSFLLFLSAFIITYNFTRMQEAMTLTGVTLGFYGGFAVLGLCYQIFFMPELNGKTLEEIDLIFQKPTRELVKTNLKNFKLDLGHLVHLRFRELIKPKN